MRPPSPRWFLSLALVLAIDPSPAAVVFYSDAFEWRNAVEGELRFNLATPGNIALADEVDSPPGPNTGLGKTLTFSAANTGFGTDVQLRALQQGAGFTFDDNEGRGPEWAGLSVGDINDYQNDNWQATFSPATVSAFGWYLGDNGNSNNESFMVYNAADELIATLESIPASGLSDFIGFTSTEPVGRVVFDEGAGGDDIAINEIFLAVIPEPSGLLMAAFAVPLALRRRRSGGRQARQGAVGEGGRPGVGPKG